MNGLTYVAVIILAVILIIGFLKLLKKPLKLVFKLLLNTLMGFIALILINIAGAFIGISIGINWINSLVVGIFGVPGVALLLILQWLLLI